MHTCMHSGKKPGLGLLSVISLCSASVWGRYHVRAAVIARRKGQRAVPLKAALYFPKRTDLWESQTCRPLPGRNVK